MHYRFLQSLLFLSVFSFMAIANAEDKNAVVITMVSVKPVALIYAALQPEAAESIQILIPADRNVHDYALSIKDLKRLQTAKTLFWLGAESEPFIAKVQKRLSGDGQWIAVAGAAPHAWLDVTQLPTMVKKMTDALVRQNPQEKDIIETRASDFLKVVMQRQTYWQQQLQPYANTPFLLGHDAFVAFASNIGLKHAELYRGGHDHGHAQGGMHELLSIQKELSEGKINCALQEPEVDFSDLAKRYPDLQLTYIEPMAHKIAITPQAYIQFFDETAQAFQQCLQAKE